MGGKGSGGHNKKAIEQHIKSGYYRPCRHGKRAAKRAAKDRKNKRANVINARNEKALYEPKIEAKGVISITPETTDCPLECPAYLDDIARKEFENVCATLYKSGRIGKINHVTLEGYCAAYSKAVRAERITNEGGFSARMPIYSKDGKPIGINYKKRPEIDVADHAWTLAHRFADALGISVGTPDDHPGKQLSELEKAMRDAEMKMN